MNRLDIVVVQLKRGISTEPLETNNVIGIVVDLGADFA